MGEQLRLDCNLDISSMTLAEIRDYLQGRQHIPEPVRSRLEADDRRGTKKLLQIHDRRCRKRRRRRRHLNQLKKYENELREQGIKLIAGLDEAGCGALAGPVMAAAIILPAGSRITGVDDCKKLTPARREELARRLKEQALAWNTGEAGVSEIDNLGITSATSLAMFRAAGGLTPEPERLLVDGHPELPELDFPVEGVAGGDGCVYSIAAASILAKIYRDRKMARLAENFPGYSFAEHRGYGTPAHRREVSRRGQTPLHRRDFSFNKRGQLSLLKQ